MEMTPYKIQKRLKEQINQRLQIFKSQNQDQTWKLLNFGFDNVIEWFTYIIYKRCAVKLTLNSLWIYNTEMSDKDKST